MREIQLTKGFVALVDDADFDWLNQWKWYVKKLSVGHLVAARTHNLGNRKTRTVYMHRQIMGCSPGDGTEVNHRNQNTLDNQQHNLRIATHQQSQHTKGPQQNNISGYKGIRQIPKSGRWRVTLHRDGHYINVGCYMTLELAIVAYNAAAIRHFGEFAWLNPV